MCDSLSVGLHSFLSWSGRYSAVKLLRPRARGFRRKAKVEISSKIARIASGKPLKVVDLFAGCGGMSLGFRASGFEIICGVELEEVRAKTHAANFHSGEHRELHAMARDISSEEPERMLHQFGGLTVSDVDVIVGGPPCQAYARIGRAKLRSVAQRDDAYLDDPRGQLYLSYLRWVEACRPVAFVMENVPDILSVGGVNVAELIAEEMDSLGYECRYTLLNAANYGVPQTRERWYMIGLTKELGLAPTFPTPTHYFDVPIGYRGTRASAARWGTMSSSERPSHAVPLMEISDGLPAAVTCKDALDDLPRISDATKLNQKRGRRDLSKRLRYHSKGRTDYQRLMRKDGADGGGELSSVSAHVIRATPRDYETFRRMEEGAEYPRAHELAEQIKDERLATLAAAENRALTPEEVSAITGKTVPRYDVKTFPNRWKKLSGDKPSHTLMAHLSHDCYSHIHYLDDQARTISVREAARLQSFPDTFEFCGAMNAAFGMIGNAVPPLMAECLASHLKEALLGVECEEDALVSAGSLEGGRSNLVVQTPGCSATA